MAQRTTVEDQLRHRRMITNTKLSSLLETVQRLPEDHPVRIVYEQRHGEFAELAAKERRISDRAVTEGGYDTLTGLRSAGTFKDLFFRDMRSLSTLLRSDERRGSPNGQETRVPYLTLTLVDVANLKGANDQHTYGTGNQLILATAQGLREAGLRHDDFLGRVGGDELAVGSMSNEANGYGPLETKLRTSLAHRYAPVADGEDGPLLDGQYVQLGAAIGSATLDAEDFVRQLRPGIQGDAMRTVLEANYEQLSARAQRNMQVDKARLAAENPSFTRGNTVRVYSAAELPADARYVAKKGA